jgi:phosphoribosylformylglycinamidine (FGAM) synthase-like enzyme
LKDGVQQIDVVGDDHAVTRSVVLDVDLLRVVDRRYAALSEDEATKRCMEIKDAEFLALHHENQYRIITALHRKSEDMKVEATSDEGSGGLEVRLKELAQRRPRSSSGRPS